MWSSTQVLEWFMFWPTNGLSSGEANDLKMLFYYPFCIIFQKYVDF